MRVAWTVLYASDLQPCNLPAIAIPTGCLCVATTVHIPEDPGFEFGPGDVPS
jgi:hypothetical protein